MVTLVNGIIQELSFLNFWSFLQLKYQSIEEGLEMSSSDEHVKLETVKVECKETHAVRHLQFSVVGTSTQPTPSAVEIVQGNYSSQIGKALNFVPLLNCDGKLIVNIEEDDVRSQSEY